MTAPLTEGERAWRRLELAVGRRLDGLLAGDRAGRRAGPGGEPDTSRPYRPGEDDVRRMDWAATARTGVPHARASIADRELATWVLVDGSASMDFGTAASEKRELAVAVVAAVAALTEGPGNRVGVARLDAAGLHGHRPRAGRAAVRPVLQALLAAPRAEPGPGATADLGAGIDRLRRERRRTGLRVVVSDLLDPPAWERPLRRLAARHDVIVVELVDPREQELPDVGQLVLVDPESGRRREVATSDRRLRARYAAAAADHRAATAAAVRRAGAHHLVLRTDGTWVTDLGRFVTARRRTPTRRRAR